MLKKNKEFNNINNYKNSKYFIEAVKIARSYKPGKDLAIIAGACQSYYEGLMLAGANFASSPERILIDYTDPLVVANEIARTDRRKFISIDDIEGKLKNGKRGINGIGAFGKCNI